MVGNPEVMTVEPTRISSELPVTQGGKRDEGCYRSTMPGFGLGQAEMSIAFIPDRPRQPD